MHRALRVIPIDPKDMGRYCQEFDRVVKEIEECVALEAHSGAIMNNWEPPDDSNRDDDTCAACDFRHFFRKSPFKGALFAQGLLVEFSDEIFNALVEKIEVVSPTHFVFVLKSGMRVEENLRLKSITVNDLLGL